ncbi:hypothetical protein NL169_000168 [Escherichia coli]|nr:hypothetical protein [Escherichia coli]
MGDLVSKNNIDRLERFHSLLAGQYWTSTDSIPEEGIVAGDTLLITSLRYVEDKLHTVILRAHPRVYGQTVAIVTEDSSGNRRERGKEMREHRFLVKDFLSSFVFEPDHKVIRDAELRQVQEEVNSLQASLTALVSDAQGLRDLAIEQLGTDDRENPVTGISVALVPSQEQQAVTSLAIGSVQNALSSGISDTRIEQIREAALKEGQISTAISKIITQRTQAIANASKRMLPYFEEVAAASLATTEEAMEYVKKIHDGVGSLELYTGKDVEVVNIVKGESAPSHLPLQVVQAKLMVDEELAVWCDLDSWFDFSDMEKFHETLRASPGLVEQIFPSERSIVCMATTRRYIDYRDPWENHVRNDRNRVVFLLIRDGQNIHQVYSSVESHLGASQLFPSASEQEAHFQGIDGSTIKFEDVSYTDRLKQHDLMALHYRRFLILICGLDHRLKLFGDFYDTNTPFSFLSLEFQERYFQFLHDKDGSGLLGMAETRPSLQSYLEQANSCLQSGSRVMCNWDSLMNPVTAPGAVQEDNSYSGYKWLGRTHKNYEPVIAFRQGDDICVNATVNRYSTDRDFNCKVNLSLFRQSTRNDAELGFLCMDTIKAEELEWYIQRRKFRSNHLFYIRFFKMALNYIRAEREAEEPYRQMLSQALAAGNIGQPNLRSELIDRCIVAWRADNRGATLEAAMSTEKGSKELLNQLYMLADVGLKHLPGVRNFISSKGYELVRLSVNASGKLVAYAAPANFECDNRMEGHAWVHRMVLATSRNGLNVTHQRFAKMKHFLPAENTLFEDEQLVATWSGKKTAFKSFEEKQRYFDTCSRGAQALKQFLKLNDPVIYTNLLGQWIEAYESINETSEYVQQVNLMAPVAVKSEKGKASLIYIGTKDMADWFYQKAPTPELQALFLEEYLSKFENKEVNKEKLLSRRNTAPSLSFYTMDNGEVPDEILVTKSVDNARRWYSGMFTSMPTMLNDQWSCHVAHFSRNGKLYLTPDLVTDEGEPGFDEILGYPRPEGLVPVTVCEFEIDHFNRRGTDANGDKVNITQWVDIYQGEREVTELLGPISEEGVNIKTYRMDSLEQAMNNISRGSTRHRPSTENSEWQQPAEGVSRYVLRSW